jgi:hypothetical protein
MNRIHPLIRYAPGGLFVVLLAVAVFTAPVPSAAWEPPPVVIGTGGGGITIPGSEGDPTDSNDYAGDPGLPGDDTDHENVGGTSSLESEPDLRPGIRLFSAWRFRLVFDPYRGVPVPSIMFYRLATPGGV